MALAAAPSLRSTCRDTWYWMEKLMADWTLLVSNYRVITIHGDLRQNFIDSIAQVNKGRLIYKPNQSQ